MHVNPSKALRGLTESTQRAFHGDEGVPSSAFFEKRRSIIRPLGCELNRLGYSKQGKVERMGDLFDNVRASSFTVLYG